MSYQTGMKVFSGFCALFAVVMIYAGITDIRSFQKMSELLNKEIKPTDYLPSIGMFSLAVGALCFHIGFLARKAYLMILFLPFAAVSIIIFTLRAFQESLFLGAGIVVAMLAVVFLDLKRDKKEPKIKTLYSVLKK